MSIETPLQYDLFTGELIDTRSTKQKHQDRERERLRQMEMFPQKELAQFGVRARPQLPLSPKTRLELSVEDLRTKEQIEHDRMKAAEAQTYSLFRESWRSYPTLEPSQTRLFPSGLRLELVKSDEDEQGVLLTDDLILQVWTTRDEEYERGRDTYHRDGYRVFQAGENQLEVWQVDESGYWRVTYSDMEMIENVEWISDMEG